MNSVNESYIFTFTSGTVALLIDAAFIQTISKYLSSFLPENHPFQNNVPSPIVDPPEPLGSKSFISLFISQEYSLGYQIDPQFVKQLRKDLRRSPTVVVDRTKTSEQNVAALCGALRYAQNIETLEIGGKNYTEIYSALSKILQCNLSITKLRIVQNKQSTNFTTFMQSLATSGIQELTFDQVGINTKQAQSIVQNIEATHVTQLMFKTCQFGKIASIILANSNVFKKIQSFVIDNDQTVLNSEQIPKINLFLQATHLSAIEINDTALNIIDAFEVLNGKDLSNLKKISFNGCKCSPSFDGKYILPETIQEVSLARVTWEGKSLINFLSYQTFSSSIDIDLSEALLGTDSKATACLQQIPATPPSNRYRSFKWDKNFITVQLLQYISNLSELEILSISYCIIQSSDPLFIPSLVSVVKVPTLEALIINKTLRPLRTNAILSIKDALISHPKLTRIEFKENGISDEGLNAFEEILSENRLITSISIDGSDLSDPDVFIRFIEFLGNLTYMKKIKRPKNDMDKLTKRSSKRNIKNELDQLWDNYKKKKRITPPSDTDDTDNSSANVSHKKLEATWDILIDIPYRRPESEWTRLKQQFSFSNLTGIDFSSLNQHNSEDDDQLSNN